jgi:hypothetical protein
MVIVIVEASLADGNDLRFSKEILDTVKPTGSIMWMHTSGGPHSLVLTSDSEHL